MKQSTYYISIDFWLFSITVHSSTSHNDLAKIKQRMPILIQDLKKLWYQTRTFWKQVSTTPLASMVDFTNGTERWKKWMVP